MPISISLEKMSVEEKLQAMEALWDDLRSRAESTGSPSWHGDVLADREAAIERGQEHFEDWDVAREQIKNQTS